MNYLAENDFELLILTYCSHVLAFQVCTTMSSSGGTEMDPKASCKHPITLSQIPSPGAHILQRAKDQSGSGLAVQLVAYFLCKQTQVACHLSTRPEFSLDTQQTASFILVCYIIWLLYSSTLAVAQTGPPGQQLDFRTPRPLRIINVLGRVGL